jgi:hypothetical protein
LVPGQREWAKIAENLVLLAVQTAGVAVPVGPVLGLYRAVRRTETGDEAFVARLLDGIERWAIDNLDAVGELPPGWKERLLGGLEGKAPVGGIGVDLLTTTVFSAAYTAGGPAKVDALVRDLTAAMPRLILQAEDRHGVLGALHALLAVDLGELGAKIDRLLEIVDQQPEVTTAVEEMLVTGYLARLATALDTDIWTALERDDSGARVSLTAIQQHLHVDRENAQPEEGPVPVEELAETCDRLVILGGPGAGKSWAAQRIAINAANTALDKLNTGTALADIELPYFAACSEVLEQSDRSSRWDRLIDASINWADDSPGDRPTLTQLLRTHPARLVVLDGIDEVATLDDRALTAMLTAPSTGTTRLVVTSRPGSWTNGLLPPGRGRHHSGHLQPFSHDDTLNAVGKWLEDQPATRDWLLQSLHDPNSALSNQAHIPLLCAMFCLVARPDPAQRDEERFGLFEPGKRLELYDAVIDKLLRARWRRNAPNLTGRHIDDIVKDAAGWLEDLAASGDSPDRSGNGLAAWADYITPEAPIPAGAVGCVDNVAPTKRGSGPKTRRFIHRSLREHLAATALWRQPPEQRARCAVEHLWFDPDWTHVIPTLLAGPTNPSQIQAQEVDQVIDRVVHHKAVAADPTHALDDMLLEVAALSRPQPALTPRRDAAIERAIQATCAGNAPDDPDQWRIIGQTAHWPATNAARERLVGLLNTDNLDPYAAGRIATSLLALAPTGTQAQHGAERLLRLLNLHDSNSGGADLLAEALRDLGLASSHPQELASRVLDQLNTDHLEAMVAYPLAWAFAGLAPAIPQPEILVEPVLRLLNADDLDPMVAHSLAWALAELAPDTPQAHEGADRILRILNTDELNPHAASQLIDAWTALAPDHPDTVQALAARIVDLLCQLTRVWAASARDIPPDTAQDHANRVVDLLGADDVVWSEDELAELWVALAREIPQPQPLAQQILDLLGADRVDTPIDDKLAKVWVALAREIPQPQPLAERILDRLSTEGLNPWAAVRLAKAFAHLRPGIPQAQEATERILRILNRDDIDPYIAGELAMALPDLAPSTSQVHESVASVLKLFSTENLDYAVLLARAVATLAPGTSQARQGAASVLELLSTDEVDAYYADNLYYAFSFELAPVSPEPHILTQRTLDLLNADGLNPWGAGRLASALAALVAPGTPQADEGADQILRFLKTDDLNPQVAMELASALAALVAPGTPQAHEGADQILCLLDADDLSPQVAKALASALAALAPGTPQAQKGAELVLVLPFRDRVDRCARRPTRRRTRREVASALAALAPAMPEPHALAAWILHLCKEYFGLVAASGLIEDLADLAPGTPLTQEGAELVLDHLNRDGLHPDIVARLARTLTALVPAVPQPQALAEPTLELLSNKVLGRNTASSLADALALVRASMDYKSWIAAFPRP